MKARHQTRNCQTQPQLQWLKTFNPPLRKTEDPTITCRTLSNVQKRERLGKTNNGQKLQIGYWKDNTQKSLLQAEWTRLSKNTMRQHPANIKNHNKLERYPKIQNPVTVFSGKFGHKETNTHFWDSKSSNRSLLKGNLQKKENGHIPWKRGLSSGRWKIHSWWTQKLNKLLLLKEAIPRLLDWSNPVLR